MSKIIFPLIFIAFLVAGLYAFRESVIAPAPAPAPIPAPAPTPEPIPTPTPVPPPGEKVTLREGQREGPFLLQKVYASYVTGLAYREYPVAMDNGSPITLYIGNSVSNGCTITMTLVSIDFQNKRAAFDKKTDFNRPCPICLSEGTLIDTPNGQIKVEQLRIGDLIWTTNILGKRVSSFVIAASRTQAPADHKVVHVILNDGRELFVSPLHPTADGRLIGKLAKGETLDGSIIISAEKIPYAYKFTYDILPAGATSAYWANGILMGSTIKSIQ